MQTPAKHCIPAPTLTCPLAAWPGTALSPLPFVPPVGCGAQVSEQCRGQCRGRRPSLNRQICHLKARPGKVYRNEEEEAVELDDLRNPVSNSGSGASSS